MFKSILSAFLLIIVSAVNAQDAGVEKCIFTVQTGPIGVWVNNEFRLSNSFAFRSEVGIELGSVTDESTEEGDIEFVGVTTLSLEPRWYYNLTKRSVKGKKTAKNSGNYFAIKGLYVPGWGAFAVSDDIILVSTIAIVPNWGIRRVYGNHFNFEAGFGVGPMFAVGSDKNIVQNQSDVYVDLHARIGYTF